MTCNDGNNSRVFDHKSVVGRGHTYNEDTDRQTDRQHRHMDQFFSRAEDIYARKIFDSPPEKTANLT